MFSMTVEYALRAITALAQKRPKAQTTQAVAEQTQVPAGYLSKVLQTLQREGLVRGARGKKGGWELAKAPETLTILQIVNAVDPIRRIQTCPLGLPGHERLCPLHQKMDRALELIEQTLASSTVAELLSQPGLPVALCAAIPAACQMEVRQ
jgi:Rrf2 family protein